MKKHPFSWLAALLVLAVAVGSCTKNSGSDNPPGPSAGEKSYNKKIDQYLSSHYLWDAGYKALKRDLAEEYAGDDNNFLTTNLMKMTDNTLDKKPDNGGYKLYSYIVRSSKTRAVAQAPTRGVTHGIKKEPEDSFGIKWLMVISFTDQEGDPSGKYGICVRSLWPGTHSAREKGIVRGTLISRIDGKELTDANYLQLANRLISPASGQRVSLTEYPSNDIVELTASEIYPDPVLYCGQIEPGVGYLVYDGFDAAYDDELLAAIKQLRTAGVRDLILDLRDNGGGHVISANMLSTCIAGERAAGKIFQYYRYNDTRMANPGHTSQETGRTYDAEKQRFRENFRYGDYYSVDLTQYTLDLNRLYVLTSGDTASSSELVINSLEGIGFDVTLIGSRTNGKNVGMEPDTFDDGAYTYELTPITFQGYNADMVTIDPGGIAVDAEVNEWNNGLVDFGPQEPLVAKALSLIDPTRAYPVAAPAHACSSFGLVRDVSILQPANPRRSGGMILLPQAVAE